MIPLQRLRALLDASTKGPWERSGVREKFGDESFIVVQTTAGERFVFFPIGGQQNGKYQAQAIADASFTVAARNQMDRLLAVAEAAEAFIKSEGEYDDMLPLMNAVRALQSTENTDGN